MSALGQPALPRGGADGEPCHACAAPLAADQRYCVACGARRGTGGPIDFGSLLSGSKPTPATAAAPAPRVKAARGAGWARSPRLAGVARPLRMPLPVLATMLLAMLCTGVALGSLPSTRSPASTAAVNPVDVVLPSAAAATVPGAPLAAAPAAQPPASTPPPPAAERSSPAVEATAGEQPAPAGDDDDTAATPSTESTSTPGTPGTADSPIEHVFVIRLGEAAVASPLAPGRTGPYLEALVARGTLLRDLRTVAGSAIADGIALLSGQEPNAQTLAGCPLFADVAPATIATDGQEQGAGCVYSAQTSTLANQLDAQTLAWRAYVEDQARGGPGVATSCRRPAAGAPDPWRDPRPGDGYRTTRNPFVYFHAIADGTGCATSVVDLAELDTDLAMPAGKMPAFSYIVPNACHDGSPTPCVAGAPAGPATADAFLAALLPKIIDSAAWPHALVVVSFDRAFAAAPGTPAADGGKVGALLLSPHVRVGRTLGGRYDTYSLLAMMEDVFGLEHLGRATKPAKRLGPGIFVAEGSE